MYIKYTQRLDHVQRNSSITNHNDRQLVIKSYMQNCNGNNLKCSSVSSHILISHIHDGYHDAASSMFLCDFDDCGNAQLLCLTACYCCYFLICRWHRLDNKRNSAPNLKFMWLVHSVCNVKQFYALENGTVSYIALTQC